MISNQITVSHHLTKRKRLRSRPLRPKLPRHPEAHHPSVAIVSLLGQSGTQSVSLETRSTIYIGGEHEDWYDPDFIACNYVTTCGLAEGTPKSSDAQPTPTSRARHRVTFPNQVQQARHLRLRQHRHLAMGPSPAHHLTWVTSRTQPSRPTALRQPTS